MIKTGTIKYYKSHEIDFIKWDTCIEKSDNGLIYAYSFYLDIMAGKWDALVLNDYEAVMPLTWNRKFCFYYLYQPYFIRALGVFGKKMTASTVHDFLNAVPKKFRYWNIDLNEKNPMHVENTSDQRVITRANYHLNLDKSYEEIYSGYKKSCQQRIKKAGRHEVGIFRDGCPADVVNFYRNNYESRHPEISSEVYSKLTDATTKCFEKGQAKIYLAKLPDGEITAAKMVLVDKNFVYSLIGGSSATGKQTASYYLITDATIKDHAGSGRIFRFEGSLIPGIASFSTQFGADLCSYLHLSRNKLPFPANLFKRD